MTELLGSGLSFPLTVDRRGGIALATGEQDVDQAIEIILSTAPGERPMRPEFGCGVHDFVFDTIDAATVGRLETEVRARARPLGAAHRGRGGRLRPLARRRRPAADQHRLPAARHQPQAQPRLSLLRDPGGGGRRVSRLPDIQLDDRRFQDLVSEARLRITRSCPEWTEHNVSDPGITLIELFAWMTEMTIYRLNRVPDKLHVTLLELLGIQLDGPSSAATDVRFRLVEPPIRAAGDPGRRDRGRHAAHRARRAVVFQVREDFTIPAAQAGRLRAPARRPGQGHRRRRRRGAPAGRRPRSRSATRRRSATRSTSASTSRSRRLVLAGRRRRLARARRRRQPRGPAAALGGLAGRQPVGGGDRPRGPHRRLQLRRRHGRAPAARRARRSSRSAATACTGCAAASTTRRATAAPPPPTRRRPRSTRSPPRRSARCCPRRTPRRRRTRSSACPTARPGQTFPLRYSPVLKPAHGRDARGPGPGVRRLGGVGAAARLRGLDHVRPPLHPQPRGGRDRARPGDPRDRRRLDPVRLGAAQGRGRCASPSTATAAGAPATSPPTR